MRLLSSLLVCIALSAIVYYSFIRQPQQPNIVLIFTDDWGYGDLALHGSLDDVVTPHLDGLAKQGVLFSNDLEPAGLPAKPLHGQEREWYRYYFPANGSASDK
ncbi:sulfatase-like hydrolase/transferase [Pseudomonadota bacterium]